MGKLYQHLSVIDEQAQEQYDVIVEQMKKALGITELLKSENSFLWLQEMNDICDTAMEIVNTEMFKPVFEGFDIKYPFLRFLRFYPA